MLFLHWEMGRETWDMRREVEDTRHVARPARYIKGHFPPTLCAAPGACVGLRLCRATRDFASRF